MLKRAVLCAAARGHAANLLVSFVIGAGHIRCVLSALKTLDGSSGSRAPAGQLRGLCEVWLVTLQASPAPPAATAAAAAAEPSSPSLQVVSSQLLMVSKGPPAAAVAAASAAASAAAAGGVSSEALLLVGEPALEDEELPAGVRQQVAEGTAIETYVTLTEAVQP
jgi:hypothetical protein